MEEQDEQFRILAFVNGDGSDDMMIRQLFGENSGENGGDRGAASNPATRATTRADQSGGEGEARATPASGFYSLKLGETQVQIDFCEIEEAPDYTFSDEWEAKLSAHDGVLVLVRFVDYISLRNLRGLCTALANDKAPRCSFLIVRGKDEQDFKMSCPECGQKLWIRDTDTEKRGRCPNCGQAFDIPAQRKIVLQELGLLSEDDLHIAWAGNPDSWEKGFYRLIEQSASTLKGVEDATAQEPLFNQTMVLEIPEEELLEDEEEEE